MKYLIFALTAFYAASSMAAKLDLVITNVKGGKSVYYAVIDDPKQFPDGKTYKAGSVKVDGSQDSTTISLDVKPGSYAISVFLDENGDGKLNKRLGIPSERFEFSNNPKLQFGPPSFHDAEIRVQEGSANKSDIKVKYFKSHIGV